jgi:tetratricopeptide (TPR) repeat protein
VRAWTCGLGLLGVLLAAARVVAAQPSAVPSLPTIALESFPPDARTGLAAALDEARRRPTDPLAAGGLGIALQAWEQWEGAHAVYLRAQALAPEVADWWYLDGLVLQRLGRPAEAADRFARAMAASPGLLTARARWAEALFDAGQLEASADAYDALAAYPAAAPVAALGRGRVAARAGRHVEAIAEFQRAVTLFPEFGAAYYALAQSLRALGRRDEARSALEQQKIHGTRWPAIDDPLSARVALVRDDPRGHLFRGLRLAEVGDLPGAIEAHEAALARNPSLAQAHANLISLYGRTSQWAQADAHYKALLAIGYNLDEAHYNYGVLLGLQRRWPEAAVAFRAAITANPLHAMARNNLGQILEGERNVTEALDQYRHAVAADPQLRLARYNLGRMLLATRQIEEAAAEFERLREPQDAESPRYVYGLAVANIQAGRRAQGVELAHQARQLAERYGQRELVAAIDRDLAGLK